MGIMQSVDISNSMCLPLQARPLNYVTLTQPVMCVSVQRLNDDVDITIKFKPAQIDVNISSRLARWCFSVVVMFILFII